MCGVCGAVSGYRQEERRVLAMVARLSHRGPEASAVTSFGGCALGHTRLRILDLREVADQPLGNEDGTVWAVYNGEIYNFRELRAELSSSGHRFKTDGDTEVLVHLYEQHGADLLKRLRGMFAFAIWDEPRRKLLLARDRLGIKPLYYSQDGSDLRFASEAHVLVEPKAELNQQALAGYLRFGWVPSPQTIFDSVQELPPGHLLEWSEGQTSIRQWAQTPHLNRGRPNADSLSEALTDSLSRHLVADVPVGLFLSSGLDSVALATLASKGGHPLRTYTVAFDEGPGESEEAAKQARRLGLPHEVIRLSCADILENLPRIIADMDQPTVDGVNTWAISRAVKQAGCTVALSGLGGDELFSGYSTFRKVPALARAGALASIVPAQLRWQMAGAFERAKSHGVRRAADAIAGDGLAAAYTAMRGVTGRLELSRLLPRSTYDPLGALSVRDCPAGSGAVTHLELQNYLPQQLLRDTDIMSMAHSLEVRVPLLDDAVVAAALGCPVDAQGRSGKARLAAAVDTQLQQVAAQTKKTFTLPFERWLRGPLKQTAHDSIERLAEPDVGLDRWELGALWDRFQQDRVHWRTIWALAVLGLWIDEHCGRVN
ncbi:MAG: asparagine synthase (glutamine-hydrolyzing) [Actinomycetota bacterium]